MRYIKSRKNQEQLTCNGDDVTIETKEVDSMEKTATLNLRVNPTLKQNAEEVLSKLGVPMSTAIDIYLNQIVLVGGLPFSVTLPNAPETIDATRMTDTQIHDKIQRGYNDYKEGRVQDAAGAFAKFRENHS